MTNTQTIDQYQVVSQRLQELHASHSRVWNSTRVRLTYRSNDRVRQVGELSLRDFGHCVDVLLDGHGGMPLEQVTRIEVMGPMDHRYTQVWEAGPEVTRAEIVEAAEERVAIATKYITAGDYDGAREWLLRAANHLAMLAA